MLQKGDYPYEYMDHWQKPNETLPENKDFYSQLNIEDITDADYEHAKRVCKGFEIKHWRECHDLYVQIDTLLLPDVFEKFRIVSLEIYESDPTKFFQLLD